MSGEFGADMTYQGLIHRYGQYLDLPAPTKNVIDNFVRSEILLDDFNNLLSYFLLATLIRQTKRLTFSDFLFI